MCQLHQFCLPYAVTLAPDQTGLFDGYYSTSCCLLLFTLFKVTPSARPTFLRSHPQNKLNTYIPHLPPSRRHGYPEENQHSSGANLNLHRSPCHKLPNCRPRQANLRACLSGRCSNPLVCSIAYSLPGLPLTSRSGLFSSSCCSHLQHSRSCRGESRW
jgi:hypothetical protein